jgi:predicted DCC family thiol-disulfide oxidoreductase YuxK
MRTPTCRKKRKSRDAASEMADATQDPGAVVDDIESPVILFDGVCNLCNRSLRLLVRFDHAGKFRFAPLQSAVGRELLERHDLPSEYFDSLVLVDGEECYTKSEAVLRICRELDGPVPLVYPLIYLPDRLRDGAYDVVAEYRYQVFGKKDECPVPEPELRERFLERSLT